MTELFLPVYAGALVRVCEGVNLGDAIGPAKTLCCGDVYRLERTAEAASLKLHIEDDQTQAGLIVAETSEIEKPG